MVENRTFAHEVQEQLMGAVQRGQKELRKRHEQLRKGRESVNVVIRTGNELAKSVRPNISSLQGKGLHLPQFAPPSPSKLREHAQEFAGQVVATQRNLAEKALHAATPLVTDGVARLNKVVALLEERERREGEKPAVASVSNDDDAQTAAAPKATAKPKAAAPKDGSPKPVRAKSSSTASKAAGSTSKPKN